MDYNQFIIEWEKEKEEFNKWIKSPDGPEPAQPTPQTAQGPAKDGPEQHQDDATNQLGVYRRDTLRDAPERIIGAREDKRQKIPNRACKVCKRVFRPRRIWQVFCGIKCKNKSHKNDRLAEYVCEYCGLLADTIDHIPPRAVRPILKSMGLANNYEFIEVRACRECNSTLGDEPVWTVRERKQYLYNKYMKKYERYIKLPEWDKSEIEELGYNLKDFVVHGIRVQAVIDKRLERLKE